MKSLHNSNILAKCIVHPCPAVYQTDKFTQTLHLRGLEICAEGSCLMRLLGLEKSRISQISLLQFALFEFWAIYFIGVICLAIFAQKIALMK